MKRKKLTWLRFTHRILQHLNLENDLDDFQVIHQGIEKDIVFRGTNLWILFFAIMVASVGLNVNSTAVIIGAMLISPLMGPITGVGYSIATYDFALLSKALKNLAFAIITGLFASTLYFTISPMSAEHSELLARTSPTIYDVLIASFGGLAGIVAISTKNKGNVIPGVAIATALMPPLCTAGYGIASGTWKFFFGAFYLFIINAVFIALASMVVAKYLRFPIRNVVDEKRKKKITNTVTVILVLTIIPSIVFGYNLVVKERFNDKATRFVKNVGIFEGNYLLRHEINPSTKEIKLIYGGESLSDAQKQRLQERTTDFGMTGAKVLFEMGFSFDNIAARNSEVNNLKAEIGRLNNLLAKQQDLLDAKNGRISMGRQFLSEIQKLHPEINAAVFSESEMFHRDGNTQPTDILLLVLDVDLTAEEKERVTAWANSRIDTNHLEVLFSVGRKIYNDTLADAATPAKIN